MYHRFLLKGLTISSNQLPVIFLQMHCAYHTWDLSPFPSLFPGLPDGKIPPLFCPSIGGRDGAAWWGCSDLHSAPCSEEPRIDWTSVVLLHWRKAAPFLFTFLVTVKQNLENTCNARFILNSQNLCALCAFHTCSNSHELPGFCCFCHYKGHKILVRKRITFW